MRRVKQRQIKAAMEGTGKNEIRRVRRRREYSSQAAKGHGKRTYQPIVKPDPSKDLEKAADSVIKRIFG